METIPEVIKKNDLKLNRLGKFKEKKKLMIRSSAQPSENDRQFVDQILKRDAESTFKKFSLNSSKSEYFKTPQRGRRSLKSIKLGSTLMNPSLGESSGHSESQERKNSRSKDRSTKNSRNDERMTPVKLSAAFSQLTLSSKPLEGSLSYFIGPGNNDLLIRKTLKKYRNWVKVQVPHTANFIWTQVRKSSILDLLPKASKTKNSETGQKFLSPFLMNRLYNRLEGNFELTSKKKLFSNMFSYYKAQNVDPFRIIPLTFHFSQGRNDLSFSKFCSKFQEIQNQMAEDSYLNNLWLIKPGESTNRGFGISISSDLNEMILKISEKTTYKGQQRTYIVQKYIYRPLLYNNRKFDIRCYAMITCINGSTQAYFYREGYLRTSCQPFSVQDTSDRFVHLTNDAVQKNSASYGMFEDSNKLSYQSFQDYIDKNMTEKISFKDSVLPRIKGIVKDTVLATSNKINPSGRFSTFEVLGYDFMLDEFFNPWLIEVNTNPCLELSGNYLKELIPAMIGEALALVIDQAFEKEKESRLDKFELIFSQGRN
jgi:tubulin--tyrosine ligase